MNLDTPATIGTVPVAGRIHLAPLAGYTDCAFRVVAAKLGCPFSYTEMVSAKGLLYGNKSAALLRTHPGEGPSAIQLFGSDPAVMADAAKKVYELGLAREMININMGCPMPKIVKNGDGSALLCDLPLAGRVIEAVAAATPLPVTVKYRRGFTADQDIAVPFAQMAEQAGAAAVYLHGRTRDQYYAGTADWTAVRRVKAAVGIPVYGNGDIHSRTQAEQRMRQTGCDGVLVGRTAVKNPFLFSQACLTPEEQFAIIEEHVDLLLSMLPQRVAIQRLRKQICHYVRGKQGSAAARAEIISAENRQALLEPVRRLL